METVLLTQLDNVEHQMITLIDSITTRNPSVEALSALLDADDDLSQALSVLALHQRNVEHINSLRKNIADMEQAYTTFSRLVEATRTEVIKVKPSLDKTSSIDASVPSLEPDSQPGAGAGVGVGKTGNGGGNATKPQPVALDTLIKFGSRISRFSIPPSALGNIFTPQSQIAPPPPPAPVAVEPTAAAAGPAQSNSANTAQDASGAAPGTLATSVPPDPTTDPATDPDSRGQTALKALSDEQKVWLDHVNRTQFFPWPNDRQIKAGALARTRNWSADDFIRAAVKSQEAKPGPAKAGNATGAAGDESQEDGQPAHTYTAGRGIQLTQPLPVNDFTDDVFDLYDPDS